MKTILGRPQTTIAGLAVAIVATTLAMSPASAQLVVIDPANFAQTTISAAENVAQTLKQVQQYQTQLQQYQNMLQNTAAPTTQIWDRAQSTMNQLRGSIDTLNHYKGRLGGIDAFLAKTKDNAGYRATPCYSYNGCTGAEWAAMKESDRFGSEAQKRANDALFKGLDMQQDALQSDAGQLQRLQASAQGASGQMQAIGYANQFASHQANQLLQIRALLIAQQNVIATRNAAIADREAKESASWDRFTSGAYRSNSGRSW
jgi:P-type conjugative transfer protein TrbJ